MGGQVMHLASDDLVAEVTARVKAETAKRVEAEMAEAALVSVTANIRSRHPEWTDEQVQAEAKALLAPAAL